MASRFCRDNLRIVLEPDPHLGDTLAATATARAVREWLPTARVAVRTRLPDVVAGSPDVEHVVAPDADPAAWSDWRHVRQHQSWTRAASRLPIADYRNAFGKTDADTTRVSFASAGVWQVNLACDLDIPLAGARPAIYLTKAEKAARPTPEPYWLVVSGSRNARHTKIPRTDVLQAIVSRAPVRWIQIGHDPVTHPLLDGCRDARGAIHLRDLFRWVFHAAGILTGVGGLMHVAAAVGTRAVVLVGGAETPGWACYEDHAVFDTIGRLPCCLRAGCWQGLCPQIIDRLCYGLVDVDAVVAAIKGGDER